MPKPLTVCDHNELWKILQKMGTPEHLTCLLRNLYASQEATVRTRHETTDWFQIGKRVHQGCILSPCLFNLYAEYMMRNAGLEEAQAGIKIAGRNIPWTVAYSSTGSSTHGILQARILEWIVISFFRGSSRPRDQSCLLHCQIGSLPMSHQG